jgi:hypothetical protein
MDVISYILFAQRSRGESFSEGFRERAHLGREDVLLGLLIAVAMIAGIWAFLRLMDARRRRRGYNNPWQLFWALCKAHGLNWSDSWLLRRVAREQRLAAPGRLFLEVDRWEEKKLGPGFALEFARLKALRAKIFSDVPRGPCPERTAPPARKAAAVPPLFPTLPAPTLDMPPWTAERDA